MIRGVHTMFYSSQADELRAFIRDKLGFPFTDVGGGWLIFDLPEGEMGVHPSDEAHAHSRAGMHSISLYCDDIHQTVADLQAKGIEFTSEVADQGYGLVTRFTMPGGVVVDLYQPKYTKETVPKPIVPPPAVLEALEKLQTTATRKSRPRRTGSSPARRKAKPAAPKKAAKKKLAKKKAPAKKPARKKGKGAKKRR